MDSCGGCLSDCSAYIIRSRSDANTDGLTPTGRLVPHSARARATTARNAMPNEGLKLNEETYNAILASNAQGAFVKDLDVVLADLRSMLIRKNLAYGDSALDPVRILTKADPRELILARIDDKLKRLQMGSPDGEDVYADLRGYFVLLGIYDLRHPRAKTTPPAV